MTELRIVERLENDSNEWVTVRMSALKEGDTFRVTDIEDYGPIGTYVATSDPHLTEDEVWGIRCILQP